MLSAQTRHFVSLLCTMFLLTISPATWAHATLQKSTPIADATLKESPKEIRLEFNEALESSFSAISINTLQGQTVVTTKGVIDPSDRKIMTLKIPALAPGQYQVKWIAVTIDGHRVKGQYLFSVTN